jgi:hypothetical protein
MKFVYRNNKEEGHPVILEVIADDILVADQILKNEKKLDPVKCPWIGCSIEYDKCLNPEEIGEYEDGTANFINCGCCPFCEKQIRAILTNSPLPS